MSIAVSIDDAAEFLNANFSWAGSGCNVALSIGDIAISWTCDFSDLVSWSNFFVNNWARSNDFSSLVSWNNDFLFNSNSSWDNNLFLVGNLSWDSNLFLPVDGLWNLSSNILLSVDFFDPVDFSWDKSGLFDLIFVGVWSVHFLSPFVVSRDGVFFIPFVVAWNKDLFFIFVSSWDIDFLNDLISVWDSVPFWGNDFLNPFVLMRHHNLFFILIGSGNRDFFDVLVPVWHHDLLFVFVSSWN